jgi:hypothetical protein
VRWTFSLVFGSFVVATVLAPLLALENRAEAAVLYAAFRPFCHQQLERVWSLEGEPLAVCVRCLGFYWGMVAGGLAAAEFGSRRAVAGAAAVCVASWGLEAAGVAVLPAAGRFITGLAVGLTVGRAVASGLAKTTLVRPGVVR